MCKSLERLFFNYYPSEGKFPRTAQGRRIKKAMRFALTIHMLLFFFSFALVGFASSLLNILMSCWTYSITLTLRESQMIFYLLILAVGIVERTYSLMLGELGNLQILGKMINLVVYCLIAYFVSKNYYLFRKGGGLKQVEKVQLVAALLREKAEEKIDSTVKNSEREDKESKV